MENLRESNIYKKQMMTVISAVTFFVVAITLAILL